MTMDLNKAIEKYLQDAVAANRRVSIADFVQEQPDFIARNSVVGEALETKWNSRISNVAKQLNIQLAKSRTKPEWGVVAMKMLDLETKSSSRPAPSRSSALTTESSAGIKRPHPSTSKSDVHSFTESMRSSFQEAYAAMDKKNMWKLDEGVYVEEKMFEFGNRCTHEHPAHSFVLNVEDECWIDVFSPEQLKIIKRHGNPTLPALSDSVRDIFNTCNEVLKQTRQKVSGDGEVISAEKEKEIARKVRAAITTKGFYDPDEYPDEDWLQRTLVDILVMYMNDVLPWISSSGSEADFITRIWSQLDKCFDKIGVQTRRDRSCVATSTRENGDRKISGFGTVSNKLYSTRPDLILFRNGVEFGAAEVGKIDDNGVGKKEIMESQLHLPKILKDMFMRASNKCDNQVSVIRKLRVIAYNQSHLRMRVYTMDSPAGYVCRYIPIKPYEIALVPSLMGFGLLQILKLTLMTKEIVRQSIKLIEDSEADMGYEEPDYEINEDDECPVITLPQVLQAGGKKKQRTSSSTKE